MLEGNGMSRLSEYQRYVQRSQRQKRVGRWVGVAIIAIALVGLGFVLAGGLAP